MRSWLLCAAGLMLPAACCANPQQDYVLNCMGCHGPTAAGVPGKIPSLANSLGGFMRTPQGRNYILGVPGAASSALDDAHLAAVLNWLAVTFDRSVAGSPVTPFTADEVSRKRRR